MSLPPIAADVVTIVLTGSFRPVTISPGWLHQQGLIGDADFAATSYELLIPQEAINFRTGWLHCVANPQTLIFDTGQQSEFERLRDLAVGVLRGQADKAVGLMGINRQIHFSVTDQSIWHAVGDGLVHNEIWENVLHVTGMRSVIYWGIRTDGYGGRVHVQVEPSLKFPPGVFLAYNDHYDLTKGRLTPSNRDEVDYSESENVNITVEKIPVAIEILTEQWTASMRRFNEIFQRLCDRTGISDGS
jgi:hypothetical protein